MAMTETAARVDLLDPHLYSGDPNPVYAWLRTNAPVYRDERNGIWGISRHRDVLAVEKQTRRYSSAVRIPTAHHVGRFDDQQGRPRSHDPAQAGGGSFHAAIGAPARGPRAGDRHRAHRRDRRRRPRRGGRRPGRSPAGDRHLRAARFRPGPMGRLQALVRGDHGQRRLPARRPERTGRLDGRGVRVRR